MVVGKAQRQKRKAAAPNASTVKKQREIGAGAQPNSSSSLSLGVQARESHCPYLAIFPA